MNGRGRLDEIYKQMRALESEAHDIYEASIKAPEVEKVCPDEDAQFMADNSAARAAERPLRTFRRFAYAGDSWMQKKPQWVAVRPCVEACKGKTFLGVYLGDMSRSIRIAMVGETLIVEPNFHNPAIYVPDMERVVFGFESWWGKLKKPEDLRQISDADIQNVWYVRALKELEAKT